MCISFLLHLGVRVIPKSFTESRIKENLQALKISLTPEDIKRLVACDKNTRLFPLKRFVLADCKLEELWDIEADENFLFDITLKHHNYLILYQISFIIQNIRKDLSIPCIQYKTKSHGFGKSFGIIS